MGQAVGTADKGQCGASEDDGRLGTVGIPAARGDGDDGIWESSSAEKAVNHNDEDGNGGNEDEKMDAGMFGIAGDGGAFGSLRECRGYFKSGAGDDSGSGGGQPEVFI